jgi:hypothetical protein
MGPDQLTRTPAGRLPGYSLVFAVTGQRREASSALVSGRARGTGCCSAAGGLGRSRWRRPAPAGFQTGSSLPKSEHDRIRFSYWSGSALSDATSVKDGKLLSQNSSTPAARPPPPAASQTTSTRWSCTCATRSDTANGRGSTDENVREKLCAAPVWPSRALLLGADRGSPVPRRSSRAALEDPGFPL